MGVKPFHVVLTNNKVVKVMWALKSKIKNVAYTKTLMADSIPDWLYYRHHNIGGPIFQTLRFIWSLAWPCTLMVESQNLMRFW